MNWLEKSKTYQENMIKDLAGLIRIPSLRNDAEKRENAPFGEACREALDYMMELGRQAGFEVQDIDGYACVLSYGEGSESIGVLGHLDVVPQGEGWNYDPFTLTEKQGVLFGRGVLDDKGPAMCGFYALKMIKDASIQLGKKVMLIYGCDEESGMECMEYYAKHGEIPQSGFVPDADFPVIYGEKGGLILELKGKADTVISSMHAGERPNIVIGRASVVLKEYDDTKLDAFDFYLKSNQLQGSVACLHSQVEFSIEGTFSHAAMPYHGNNAALHLLNFVSCAYGDVFAKELYERLCDWQGKPLGIAMEGAYMGFLTLNTGIVHIEQGEVSITLDIRYPNDTTGTAVYENVKKAFASQTYPLDVVCVNDSVPLFVDPNSELVTTLMDVYREYSNDTFYPAKTMGGGTYARKLPNFVAFGPEFPKLQQTDEIEIGGPHQKNEGIHTEELIKAMAIYAAAIERLAK